MKHLDRAKSIDFFQFVLNPQSIGQTVENIFHTAFLIKDGQAQFRNEKGVPRLELAQPPVEQDYSSGRAQRRQCVLRFDWDTWSKLKDIHSSTTGFLPHRKPGEYFHPGLQNAPLTTSSTSNTTTSNGKHSKKSKSKTVHDNEEEGDGIDNDNNNNNNNNNKNNKKKKKNKDMDMLDSEKEGSDNEYYQDVNNLDARVRKRLRK